MRKTDKALAVRVLAQKTVEISRHLVSVAMAGPIPSSVKADGSILTTLDLWSQELLCAEVGGLFPQSLIICEETTTAGTQTHDLNKRWECITESVVAIDPLDGTENYTQGLPFYGISIGALKFQQNKWIPDWGIIAVPALDTALCSDGTRQYQIAISSGIASPFTESVRSSVWLVPRWFYGAWTSEPKPLRTTGSSVFDLYHVIRGAAMCTFSRAHLWDLLGGLGVGFETGVSLFSMEDGTPMGLFSEEAFGAVPHERNYQLAQRAIICRQSHADYIYNALGGAR